MTDNTDWLAVVRKAAEDTLAAVAVLETVPVVGAHEAAKRPTVPGVYQIDAPQAIKSEWGYDGHEIYMLNASGNWVDVGWGAPDHGAALTRLAPAAETAEKISAYLWENRDDLLHISVQDDVRALLFGLEKQFGVQS